MQEEIDDSQNEIVSKSQRKRDMHRLQKMGEQLSQLKSAQWEPLELPLSLLDALANVSKIKKHEARRRHLQFIGKLMRKLDEASITKITVLLDSIQETHQQSANHFKHIEEWRDKLVAGDAQSIEVFLKDFPGADRQWLRQMQRSCKHEAATNKPPMAARKLFKYLREHMDQ